MYINVNISQNFRVQKAFNDLLSVISQVAEPREVVTNPNVGELVLVIPGKKVTPEDDKAFWAKVADAISPYYDVLVTDTEFTLLDKTSVPHKKEEVVEKKPEIKKETKKEESAILKRAKRLFKKSGNKKDI